MFVGPKCDFDKGDCCNYNLTDTLQEAAEKFCCWCKCSSDTPSKYFTGYNKWWIDIFGDMLIPGSSDVQADLETNIYDD